MKTTIEHYAIRGGIGDSDGVFNGTVEYRWVRGQPEPDDVRRWNEAALADASVEIEDHLLGKLTTRVEEIVTRYDAQRRLYEARVSIVGWRALAERDVVTAEAADTNPIGVKFRGMASDR